jgi:hypothetical protein
MMMMMMMMMMIVAVVWLLSRKSSLNGIYGARNAWGMFSEYFAFPVAVTTPPEFYAASHLPSKFFNLVLVLHLVTWHLSGF